MMANKQIIFRLILAAVLGGLIGLEREVKNRPAGIRTHVLVTLGSTLIMLISIDGFYIPGTEARLGDPYRLAAQVVSGIGFLGAGTIMRIGDSINGLTTAASLWVSAGIGLAIGTGYYLGAIVVTIIVISTLMLVGTINDGILTKKYRKLMIVADNRTSVIKDISSVFEDYHVLIKDISMASGNYEDNESLVDIVFMLQTPMKFNQSEFINSLNHIEEIKELEYEGSKL